VALERRSLTPLVRPGLLHLRTVAVSNAAMGLKAAIGVSQLFVLTLYFQEALGLTPLTTGLLFFPMTLTAVLAASIAGLLATRFGVKPTAVLGLALLAAGLLLLTGMSADGGLVFVFSGMVIGEAGFMLAEVPLTIAATTGVGADKRALAAGVLNTSIQLGNALGLGVIATVVAAGASALGGEAAGPEALVGGLRWALLTGTGFVAASLLLVLVALRDGKARRRT
jgi:MFS family permease